MLKTHSFIWRWMVGWGTLLTLSLCVVQRVGVTTAVSQPNIIDPPKYTNVTNTLKGKLFDFLC
jgi:hypothetical protein